MAAVRLGKMHLRWCDSCNVPVLELPSCGSCGGKTRQVKLTPPGDARPAFEHDFEKLRSLIDGQFGAGCGVAVVPNGRLMLLNKAPDLDRMDEVILGGNVVGAVRYDIRSGERFLPRPRAALHMQSVLSRGWVKVDAGAVKAIQERKASALAVGVIECAPDIAPGDEVIVIDEGGEVVSVGVSKMASYDMMARRRGTAVKTRWTASDVERVADWGPEASWENAIEANREAIDRRVSEATAFIKKLVKERALPVAVSYSGGKDSLATLLLVLESDVSPKLLFVDTGLEFEETVRNVTETAERHSLDLIVESAGDGFWNNVGVFGPPAKDYRWCCKTCKLGPATRLIQKHFSQGVLSFIGQRAYESESRARKGRVWKNPWTPNQLGASPIQRWTAMHVWLYLFDRRARYNVLYERGFERIGCFLCPSADMAEFDLAQKSAKDYARWEKALKSYSESKGLREEWFRYGLWRWRRIPKSVLDSIGIDELVASCANAGTDASSPLEFHTTEAYSPCVEGLSMEGVFTRTLDMDRVGNLLNAMGVVTLSPDKRIAEVAKVTVFSDGPVMIKANDEERLKTKAAKLKEVVMKATGCAGCGICVGRCPNGALILDGRARIDESLCDHCGSCFGPCPVVAFRENQLDI
ncbi:MAG: phosphoadenosine phosphosulfate reductase family protein [Methanobacteriota archaeon]|nr:MAG: phosphoadenosine phosphosulfate reductase family protein [Euryarchaeota archaeon]